MSLRYQKKIILLVCVVLFIAGSLYFVNSAAGNFCTTSPCSCGTACQNGGNEVSNGYNTIDSCQDGSEDIYEYVHDITITDLNSSVFRTGDTIEIDAYVDCDLDGDEISFVYHNGTGWRSFHDVTCAISGKTHYYKNLTLDSVPGNHTIRITLAFSGTTGMICAYDHDSIYSDTDDLSFEVQDSAADLNNPSVTAVLPSPGRVYFSDSNLVINISANVSDDNAVSNVSANITWSTKSEIINMVNTIGSKYEGNFTNTTDITRYDVTILAYDSNGNLNNTETTYFFINATTNLTITYPEDGNLYPALPSVVDYTISEGPVVDITWVDHNGVEILYGVNKWLGLLITDNSSVDNYQYANLSQSFFVSNDMYVNRLSVLLKINGTGTNNSRIEIRNSTNGLPSNISLAYASINNSQLNASFRWLNLTLNHTILLRANTSYWLVLVPNGTAGNFTSWAANADLYTGGNFSQNSSMDLVFKLIDKYRFNASFTPSESTEFFQAFANTSFGTISSSLVIANFDFTSPQINDYYFSPEDIMGQDPGSLINITANVTDNLAVKNVTFHYKLQNESTWINKTMSAISGLYVANFNVSDETNISYKITAIDTSNNQQETFDNSLEILYEWNWTIIPEELNATGVTINMNKTISNLS